MTTWKRPFCTTFSSLFVYESSRFVDRHKRWCTKTNSIEKGLCGESAVLSLFGSFCTLHKSTHFFLPLYFVTRKSTFFSFKKIEKKSDEGVVEKAIRSNDSDRYTVTSAHATLHEKNCWNVHPATFFVRRCLCQT